MHCRGGFDAGRTIRLRLACLLFFFLFHPSARTYVVYAVRRATVLFPSSIPFFEFDQMRLPMREVVAQLWFPVSLLSMCRFSCTGCRGWRIR